jgi:hypothetical protein
VSGERNRKQWYGGILDIRNGINSTGSFQNILFYLRLWEKILEFFFQTRYRGKFVPFQVTYAGGPQSRETVPLILAFSTNETSFI